MNGLPLLGATVFNGAQKPTTAALAEKGGGAIVAGVGYATIVSARGSTLALSSAKSPM